MKPIIKLNSKPYFMLYNRKKNWNKCNLYITWNKYNLAYVETKLNVYQLGWKLYMYLSVLKIK